MVLCVSCSPPPPRCDDVCPCGQVVEMTSSLQTSQQQLALAEENATALQNGAQQSLHGIIIMLLLSHRVCDCHSRI